MIQREGIDKTVNFFWQVMQNKDVGVDHWVEQSAGHKWTWKKLFQWKILADMSGFQREWEGKSDYSGGEKVETISIGNFFQEFLL